MAGFLCTNVYAQDVLTGSGSSYSYLGLGIPVDFRSSQASGMGLTGVAISNVDKPSLANPAFWGNAFYTTISAGMTLNYFEAVDNFATSENTNINFTHAHVVLPLVKNRVGLSLSVFPETQSRYNIETLRTIGLPTSEGIQDIEYSTQNIGLGGLNRIETGIGVRISPRLYLGYAPSLLFGVIRSENNLIFNSNQFQPVNYTVRTRYRAFGHRFGISANTISLFRDRDRLEFGAMVSLPANLDANRRLNSNVISDNRIGTVQLIPEDEFGQRTISYPIQVTAGLTYYPSRYVLFSGEVNYQQWSEYNDFDPTLESFTEDRLKIGIGGEYNLYNRGNSGFFNSFVYRAGVSYDTGHLTINGADIETVLFSIGLGVPVRTAGSSIDLGFDFGTRGTRTNNLVRERIFAFTASFNLSELMFLQRRLN